MKSDPLETILESSEKLLRLEPEEVERANELGEEIVDGAAELEGHISGGEDRAEYGRIYAKLKKRQSELSRDIANSRGGPLSSDWRRFAKKDTSKLKDEVLALQEFIGARRKNIRKSLNKEHGPDIEGLADRIREEEAVDDVAKNQLTSRVEEMSEKELREKTQEFRDRLKRISKWLLTLEGIRAEV